MNHKKKLIALLLTLTLVLSYYPAIVFAEPIGNSGSCGDGVTYTLSDDGTLTISGTGMIAEGYFCNNNEAINKLVIEEGVTAIDNEAFYSCKNLKTVYIPNSMNDIGEDAFGDCISLSDIYYPGSWSNWTSISYSRYGNSYFTGANLHLCYGTEKQDYLFIIYNLDGGTINGESDSVVEEFAELTQDYELPEAIKSRYVFKGWTDKNDDSVTTIAAGTTGAIILYANWSEKSDSVGKTLGALDVPTATKGKTYNVSPFIFADDGNSYEVSYTCRELEQPMDYDETSTAYKQVTEKDGLTFGADGSISGSATADGKWLDLIAGITSRDSSNKVVDYIEYQIFLHIDSDSNRYDIPSNVSEIDLSSATDTDWYKCVDQSDEWAVPYYKYTVSKGQSRWVKVRVSSTTLNVDTDWNTPTVVVGADGYRRSCVNEAYIVASYRTNPGEYYYIYTDNTAGTDDTGVYINDGSDNPSCDGGIGTWSYEKKKTGVDNPMDNSGKKWDVYTVGNIKNDFEWNVKGYSPYGWDYYYCAIDVISKVPVYYIDPRVEKNFGTSYSIYRYSELTTSEEKMKLQSGETHNKINYYITIADNSYSTSRKSKFFVDVYIPAGYTLYKADDKYLHVKEVSDNGSSGDPKPIYDADETAGSTTGPSTTPSSATSPSATPSTVAEEKVIVDLKTVKISKPKSAKKAVTVKWKKVGKKDQKKIQGIEIQVSTDPGFQNIVKQTTAGKKKASKKIKGLKSKTKYWVRIRAYKNAADGKHVSVWKTKTVKVK